MKICIRMLAVQLFVACGFFAFQAWQQVVLTHEINAMQELPELGSNIILICAYCLAVSTTALSVLLPVTI